MWERYGAVLIQGKRPIAYLSKARSGVQTQALSTYEKELWTLVTAVQKWRHYLQGGPLIIKTYHVSFQYLIDFSLLAFPAKLPSCLHPISNFELVYDGSHFPWDQFFTRL